MGVSNFIETIHPENNTSNVAVDTAIEILFNSPMNRATLNDETIYLSSSKNPVQATYVYEGQSKKLTIQPIVKLDSNEFYQLNILSGPDGPKNFIGQALDASTTTYFQTEEVLVEDEIELPEAPQDEHGPEASRTNNSRVSVSNFEYVSSLYLERSYPKSGGLLNNDKNIVLIFPEEVDPGVLNDYLEFYEEDILEKTLVPLTNARTSPTKRHVLTPQGLLNEGARHYLVIKEGLPGGGLTLEEDIVLTFYTNWNDLYASVEDVRLLLGDFGDRYTDEELNRMIHKQSQSTHELMRGLAVYVPEEWVGQYPYAAGQYVLYKVSYQAILGQVMASASGVRRDIQLGDFRTSSSENTSSSISDVLGLFERELDKWWRRLNGELVDEVDDPLRPNFIRTAGSALRGEVENPNPEFTTRVPFRELGG